MAPQPVPWPLTGDPRRVAWEPGLMPGVVHFLDPYRYRSTFHRTNPDISDAEFCQDYLNHLEEIIRYEGPETIAAVSDGIRHRHEWHHHPAGWIHAGRACLV